MAVFIQGGHLIFIEKSMLISTKLFILTLSFFLLGCNTHAGLNRTPFEKSSKMEFDSIGFTIMLPDQSVYQYNNYRIDILDSTVFQKNAKLIGKVYFGFHPIHGTHPMSEPDYLVDVNLIRFSEKQFDLFKQGKHYLLSDPCYKNINIELSETMSERVAHDKYNKKDYHCFYKTALFDNGDILVLSSRLLLTNNYYIDDDFLFIRDLINSVSRND